MSSLYDEYRDEIILLLLSARKNDPWPRERIAGKLGIPHNTSSEKNSFKRYVRDLIKIAKPGSSLSVVGNDGKGYYYPEYEDEAEVLKLRRVRVGKGFFIAAQKYEAHKKVAKKRPQQLTLDDIGVETFESS